MSVLLSSGRATCIREPRCDHGLEGYNLGQAHRYEERRGVLASRPSEGEVRYYRVWPVDPGEDEGTGYFEVCMPGVFAKYFEVRTSPRGDR